MGKPSQTAAFTAAYQSEDNRVERERLEGMLAALAAVQGAEVRPVEFSGRGGSFCARASVGGWRFSVTRPDSAGTATLRLQHAVAMYLRAHVGRDADEAFDSLRGARVVRPGFDRDIELLQRKVRDAEEAVEQARRRRERHETYIAEQERRVADTLSALGEGTPMRALAEVYRSYLDTGRR